jgi:hypothetical protein
MPTSQSSILRQLLTARRSDADDPAAGIEHVFVNGRPVWIGGAVHGTTPRPRSAPPADASGDELINLT